MEILQLKKENLTVEENERPTEARPVRAAARDARLKTQIMLDDAQVQSSRRGEC